MWQGGAGSAKSSHRLGPPRQMRPLHGCSIDFKHNSNWFFGYCSSYINQMDRFFSFGLGLATPVRDEAELRAILAGFGVSFDEAAVHKVYLRLAVIIGKWFSEQDRVEVKPKAKALLRISKDLTEACQLMSGFETGFRNSFEIIVTKQLRSYLALDPTVGRNAQELIGSFRRQAAQIAHACMIGYTDLSGEAGRQGRLALGACLRNMSEH
ncbi:MAG: hypothetical protein WAV78_37015 [Xanthobacteraceae bacterium]